MGECQHEWVALYPIGLGCKHCGLPEVMMGRASLAARIKALSIVPHSASVVEADAIAAEVAALEQRVAALVRDRDNAHREIEFQRELMVYYPDGVPISQADWDGTLARMADMEQQFSARTAADEALCERIDDFKLRYEEEPLGDVKELEVDLFGLLADCRARLAPEGKTGG